MDNEVIKKSHDLGCIVLSHPDRGLCVFDRLGKSILYASHTNNLDDLQCGDLFFKKALPNWKQEGNIGDVNQKVKKQYFTSISIHINSNFLWEEQTTTSLLYLFAAFGKCAINLEISLSQNFNWQGVFHFLELIKHRKITIRNITILGELSECECVKWIEEIFRYRIIVCQPFILTQKTIRNNKKLTPKVISQLAEYGILVPLRLYVDSLGIDFAEDIIKEFAPYQMYSGFSVLPIFLHTNHHLFYPIEDFETEKYIRLLFMLYKNRERCESDVVWEPFYEMINIAFSGGWSEQIGIPLHIQLLVNSDGSLNIFRQVPFFAKKWSILQKVEEIGTQQLFENFVEFVEKNYVQRFIENSDCQFRYLCCCLDHSCTAPSDVETNVLCKSRKTILEVFLWHRFLVYESTNKFQ
jgi:hypothetical protein